jgi:tetratricopeptide (TPR) repeat protein
MTFNTQRPIGEFGFPHGCWLMAILCLVAAGICCSAVHVSAAPLSNDQKIDAFLETVRERDDLTDEHRAEVIKIVESLRAEPGWREAVITVALREIYPDYQAALTLLGEEQTDAAIERLVPLCAVDDRYLRGDAAYYLARAYILHERFEEAVPLLKDLSGDGADTSLYAGECLFLYGVAASQLLDRKTAIELLERYLKENPDAPERMRVGAWRQLVLLQSVEDGSLTDVLHRMQFSRRRLSLKDAGQKTREEQDRIVAMLEKLIKDAEEQESKCGCSGGGGESGGDSGGGGGPDGEGEGPQGPNDQTPYKTLRRVHRGGPRSPWGELRGKDRERVFAALKGQFPGRYRQLIEQYYRSLQEEEGEE